MVEREKDVRQATNRWPGPSLAGTSARPHSRGKSAGPGDLPSRPVLRTPRCLKSEDKTTQSEGSPALGTKELSQPNQFNLEAEALKATKLSF